MNLDIGDDIINNSLISNSSSNLSQNTPINKTRPKNFKNPIRKLMMYLTKAPDWIYINHNKYIEEQVFSFTLKWYSCRTSIILNLIKEFTKKVNIF